MAHLEDAIPGLAEFTRWFAEDATRYVVIGGVAREMIYREAGLWEESGTKDFDMVLIAEALDAPFVAKFIQFVREARYSHVTKSGDAQMFRFCRPASSAYPHQIELLSRRPDYLEGIEARIGKVPVENAAYSLSAILLDEAYYGLLASKEAVTHRYGFPTLSHEYLPLFKMKAYLNLREARANGEPVRSGEIGKHRRDIFRLCSLLPPTIRVELPGALRTDVKEFVEIVECPPHFMKDIGLAAYAPEEVKEIIIRTYL